MDISKLSSATPESNGTPLSENISSVEQAVKQALQNQGIDPTTVTFTEVQHWFSEHPAKKQWLSQHNPLMKCTKQDIKNWEKNHQPTPRSITTTTDPDTNVTTTVTRYPLSTVTTITTPGSGTSGPTTTTSKKLTAGGLFLYDQVEILNIDLSWFMNKLFNGPHYNYQQSFEDA